MLQLLINSIISGLLLALVAWGFSMIFRVTKVFHLAHAGIFVIGAYAFWYIYEFVPSILLAGLGALTLAVLCSLIIEKWVYLPINKNSQNQTVSLISSMASYLIIINLIAMKFGSENHILSLYTQEVHEWGDLLITQTQIIQLCVSIAVLWGLAILLRTTNTVLIFKAVDDKELITKVLGVSIEKQRLKAFTIGGFLVTVAAILKLIDIGIDPYITGMNITLTATVVSILVGRVSVIPNILVAVVLTLLQNIIEWELNSQWKEGLTFFLLLLVIIYKTEGILSYNLRKDHQ